MKKKIVVGLMVLCLLAFVAVFAFSQSSTNVRWEYTSLTTDWDRTTQELNELGRQGWEAVAAQGGTILFKRRLP
jgi:CHASE3 domain sensor protein